MQNAVTACAIAAAGIAMGSVAGDANAPLAPYACLPIPAALQETPPQSLDAEQRALAAHLSRRFFVAQSEAGRFVAVAYRAAQEVGLDPLLVLAVIAVESRFNPIAESVAGAKGLMQIIPRYHHAKLERYGGEQAVLDRVQVRVPALVVTEIMIPKVDGLTLCRRLREDPLTRHVPVVVFSILAAAARADDAGATAFLRKPLVEAVFVTTIRDAIAAQSTNGREQQWASQ